MNSGAGIYFDGLTSARSAVVVELAAAGLQISDRDGRARAKWPYDEIESLTAPDNILRLGRRGSATLERLEIRDPAFAAEIDARAAHVDRTDSLQRRQRMSVIGWSVGATASLLLVAWFGVPAIATRLTPLLPAAVERKLGDAVNMQVRGMLDTRKGGAAFDCGTATSEMPGRAALDKLVRRLEAAAALPLPLRTNVVRRTEANALALPGGQVYVFQGLIAKAANADEVAGVMRMKSATSLTATGPRRCWRAAACRSFSACCLAISSAVARLYSQRRLCCNHPIHAKRKGRRTPMAPTS